MRQHREWIEPSATEEVEGEGSLAFGVLAIILLTVSMPLLFGF
jgi:hypothetical protein